MFCSVQKPFSSSWKCIAHKAWHWILPQFHGLLIHTADTKTIVKQKFRKTLHYGKKYITRYSLLKFLPQSFIKNWIFKFCLILSYFKSRCQYEIWIILKIWKGIKNVMVIQGQSLYFLRCYLGWLYVKE